MELCLRKMQGVGDPEKILYSVWEEELEWVGETGQVL